MLKSILSIDYFLMIIQEQYIMSFMLLPVIRGAKKYKNCYQLNNTDLGLTIIDRMFRVLWH